MTVCAACLFPQHAILPIVIGSAHAPGLFILTTTTSAAPITPSRLEGIALYLSTNARDRDLIWLYEAWAETEEPTTPAKLAVCRAFYSLRQMDRAWIRLRPLVEGDEEPTIDALLLAAEIFIERGWPTKARKFIDQALHEEPENPRLQRLSDRASKPPNHPEDAIREEAPEADLDSLIPLAETYLATGAFLKGQAILEGLKRHHPDNERVDELLWALRGDFQSPDSLSELANRWGPQSIALPDFEDEAEHTESVSLADLHRTLDEEPAESSGSFPTLFRSETPEPPPDLFEADDITQSLDLATRQDMLNPPPPSDDEALLDDGGVGDTQILRVIQSESGPVLTSPTGPSHHGITEQDTSFDLARYREQMGFAPPRSAGDSDFDDLEGEDDDLIIVTRREDSDFLGDDPTTSDILLDEPESVPTPGSDFAAALRAEQEAEEKARQSAEQAKQRAAEAKDSQERAARARQAAQEAVRAAKSQATATPGRPSSAWVGVTSWFLILGLLLGFAAVALAALAAYQFLF